METARPAPSNLGGLMRAVTKIVRFGRTTGGGGTVTSNGISPDDDDGVQKVKFSEYFEDASSVISQSQSVCRQDDEKKLQHQKQQLRRREDLESLLAKLFASISAVKAAYAQLQIAQSPYDPDTIQSADQVVVSELKHLSQLKQSYLKKQIDGGHHDHHHHQSARDSQLLAEIQEQRNLLKTFQITIKKLESDFQHKDSELVLLKDELSQMEKQNRSIEAKLYPNRSLYALDDLHLSGLNPTHFLTVLRYTVKSIGSFVNLMVHEMEHCRWDLDATARSIEPDVLCGKLEHRVFAFKSFVSRMMLSDFRLSDFGLVHDDIVGRWSPDRQWFFKEFTELKFAKLKQMLDGGDRNVVSTFGKFCRAKYLTMVHPRMEGSFFGNLDQRALVSSGRGFPETEFFLGFAEMARRVWLLHCLFFSFGPEAEASIFQVRRGCRFSEVYMESVVEEAASEWRPTVGFTVVPGFKVGKTVIQCRVYLARTEEGR